MSVVLGIDGGGTNTRAAIVADGEIVGSGQSGSIKRLRVGAVAAEANLRTVLKEAYAQAGVKGAEKAGRDGDVVGSLRGGDADGGHGSSMVPQGSCRLSVGGCQLKNTKQGAGNTR